MKCKTHPTYKAVRVPRTDCTACWTMYNEKHPEVPQDGNKTVHIVPDGHYSVHIVPDGHYSIHEVGIPVDASYETWAKAVAFMMSHTFPAPGEVTIETDHGMVYIHAHRGG